MVSFEKCKISSGTYTKYQFFIPENKTFIDFNPTMYIISGKIVSRIVTVKAGKTYLVISLLLSKVFFI